MRGLVEIWLTLTDLATSGGDMAPPATTCDLRRNSARGRVSLFGTVTLGCEGAMAPLGAATPGVTFVLLCNAAPVSLTGTVTLDCEGAVTPPDFARSLMAPPGMTFDLRRNSASGRVSLFVTVTLDCEGAMGPPRVTFVLLCNPAPVSLTGTVTLDCEGAMAPLDFAR